MSSRTLTQLALKHATYNKFDYPRTYLGIKSNKVLELWTSCLSTVFLTNSRGSSAHVQNYNRACSRLKIDLTHHFRLLGWYPATEKKEMKAFYIWTWPFHVLNFIFFKWYIYKRPTTRKTHKLNFSSTYRQKIYTFENVTFSYILTERKKEEWANIRTDEWQNKE